MDYNSHQYESAPSHWTKLASIWLVWYEYKLYNGAGLDSTQMKTSACQAMASNLFSTFKTILSYDAKPYYPESVNNDLKIETMNNSSFGIGKQVIADI